MERSFNSTEPTSVHRIAASLGQRSDKYLREDFPELCTAITQKIAQVKQDRLERMRWTLQNALGEKPAPTLTDLSRRLGYPHTAVLWRHHSDLCNQFMVRRRADAAKRRVDLERIATAALEELPVPSLRAVCRRLDITVRYMGVHFPALVRRIVEEHRRSVSAETANRHALLLRRIPDLAAGFYSQGVYPSVERILEQLPERSRRDWKTISFAVREAHKALAIDNYLTFS